MSQLFANISSLVAAHASPGGLVAEGETGGGLTGMLPILLMFAVVYFVILRPMSKQEKGRRKRLETLKKGDQVVIGGGILGRISNADDPKIAVVEIADRVRIRVLKKDILDTQAEALKDDKKDKKDKKDKGASGSATKDGSKDESKSDAKDSK